jgi:hypothetical protein
VEVGHRTTNSIAVAAPTFETLHGITERTGKREGGRQDFFDHVVVPGVPGLVVESHNELRFPALGPRTKR